MNRRRATPEILEQLRPELAAAAQRVYDAWDQDEEGRAEGYGYGGICHVIADAFSEVLYKHGIGATTFSFSDETHVTAVADIGGAGWRVDVLHGVYETGGGLQWRKIKDVVFEPDDILIETMYHPFRDYLEEPGDEPDEAVAENPFLAEPSGQHHGPAAGGTASFPGFHTASSVDVVVPYAQKKAVDEVVEVACGKCRRPPCKRCVPLWSIPDYPVIVGVDMSGINPIPDYDAAVLAMDALQVVAQEAINDGDPWRFLDTLPGLDQEELPDDVMGVLFYRYADCVSDPGRCLQSLIEDLSTEDALDLLREIVKGGRQAEKIAMRVIGQYRYDADVSDDRIVEVLYMKPFWPLIVSERASDEYVSAISAAGWNLVSEGFEDDTEATITRVWESGGQQHTLFGDKPRVEYHGTSLRNLLRAAPWLADELPAPPWPFKPIPEEAHQNPGPVFVDSVSPLDYSGHHPSRLSLVDPTASPPGPAEPWFSETRNKKGVVLPGSAPGVVAFVDYDLDPGYGLVIHYTRTRPDLRARGLMKTLLDELIGRHLDVPVIDFGVVLSGSVQHYLDRLRAQLPEGIRIKTRRRNP